MLKVAIYLRKSTDSEDSQMLSLEKQRNSCAELLRHVGEHEVVKTWEESVSAKKSGKRPGFKEMISMIKKGEIDTIVVWKLSRLARNSLDQAYIENLLFEENKIKLIASQDGLFRPGDNVHLLRIHFGESTQYSRNLGKDASEGMLTKVRGGQPVKIPRGYEFDKYKNAKPTDEAVAIREVFRLKRAGYTNVDIAKSVESSHHMKLSKSSVDSIVKNPIYYGMIRYMGELYKGEFEAIVPYDEWKEANSINRSTRRDTKKDELDFCRGLIKNMEGGGQLSPYLKEGLIYFSSTARGEGKTINISLGKIISYFDSVIHTYSLPKEYQSYCIEGIRHFYKQENEIAFEQKEVLEKEIKAYERKLSTLLEMRMNQELESDEYKKLKNEVMENKEKTLLTLSKIYEKTDKMLRDAENSSELIVDLSQTWKNANLIGKVQIIKMITSELFIDYEKALHLEERELFYEVKNLNDTVWLSVLDDSRVLYGIQSFEKLCKYLLQGYAITLKKQYL